MMLVAQLTRGVAETVIAASACKVGAGTGPSGTGEKSQGDSHAVKMGGLKPLKMGRRTRRPGIARG